MSTNFTARLRTSLLIALFAVQGTSAVILAQTQTQVPLYDNLGDYHYAITAATPLAQQYFDQGLRLYYAFNHAEAIRAFNEGARLDPNCGMCYWGTALSYGPNINLPMDSASGVAAYAAAQKALAVTQHVSAKERDMIDALATRYEEVPSADRTRLDTLYSQAMGSLAQKYSSDLEILTLYAESIMDLSPWEYWNRDGSPRPDTPGLLAVLETVTSISPDHPGANHFYIHAVEAVDPERAVSAAERLAGLMPGAGHLVHMPGHIYVRVGRYEDAIMANMHAVHADETYIADQNPAFGVYVAGYYPHNYDFLAFAASMIGRSGQSIQAADKMTTLSSDDLLWEPGMAFLQHHRTRHLQFKVRFGRWDEILAVPAFDERLIHASAMWHYAQGRALVAKGDVEGAREHLKFVEAASTNPEMMDTRLEFNTSGVILSIAAEVLAGHISEAAGDLPSAVSHLETAAEMESNLVYGEPPDWSVPVREELGMVLLRAGDPTKAEEVFREDLHRFPDNGWSLHGLAMALKAQGKDDEAAEVSKQFDEIWASADVEL